LPPKKDKRKIEIYNIEKHRREAEDIHNNAKIDDENDSTLFHTRKIPPPKRREKEKAATISLTCGDCGRYIPIDADKFPEAKNFIFPTPRDFRYIFLCASCNDGSLHLQHLLRTREQIQELVEYNLRLQGLKEISNEDILRFVEQHKDDLFPTNDPKKDESSSSDDSESKSDEMSVGEAAETAGLETPESPPNLNSVIKTEFFSDFSITNPSTCTNSQPVNGNTSIFPELAHVIKDNNSNFVLISPSKEIFPVFQALPSNSNPSDNGTIPMSKSISNFGTVYSNLESTKTTKRRAVREKKCDIFLYFEGEAVPFGFVRINSLMSMKQLRDMILEEDVAKLGENDLFIYKKATIKIKQEPKLFIKECMLQDLKGHHMILVRKFLSGGN